MKIATVKPNKFLRSKLAIGRRVFLAGALLLFAQQAEAQLQVEFTKTTPVRAAPLVYVTNTNANSVSVVDPETLTVLATIPVGMAPIQIAVTSQGSRAVAVNFFSASASVIDTAARSVVATVTVGSFPTGVAITPDGKHAYVVMGSAGIVSVVDLSTNTVVDSISVGVSALANTGAVAISPDGSRAYVASGSISVIDTATNTVVATLTAGIVPVSAALTPDGAQVHVVSELSGEVSAIDTQTQIGETLLIGDLPFSIAITPDGTRAYIGVVGQIVQAGEVTYVAPLSLIRVVDLATFTHTDTITLSGTPSVIAMHPDGSRAFVTIPSTDELAVVDTQANVQIASMVVGDSPTGVAISR